MKLITVFVGAVTMVLMCGVSWRKVLERFTRSQDGTLVDSLIAQAGARPIRGMERPDWHLINRLGQRQWEQALRAQRRQRDHKHEHQELPQLRQIA